MPSLKVSISLKYFIAVLGLIGFIFIFIVYLNFNPNYPDPFKNRYSKVVLDRNQEILSIFLDKNEQWHIRSDEPIPDKLKTSVITFEDKRFYTHIGIDFLSIGRAFIKNFTTSKESGASTLNMQIIKILEKNKRTYFNKFIEMIKAVKLNNNYTKDEILRIYLNNAPYGGNVIGYKSAALFLFDTKPSGLTWAQSALLAVLPNAPGMLNITKNRSKLLFKRNSLLNKLYLLGNFDKDTLKLSLKEPLPKGFIPHRNLAPHLALRLSLKSKKTNIQTTIDKNIQKDFENIAKNYNEKMMRFGIQNLSVLLLNTKTSEALAYIGSQDFYDIKGLGQIDGIVAKRSPGSLLKPLLYALSIDDGLIAPTSLLTDVPLYFANFNPRNASKRYYGLISAKQALIKSLNIPFVKLLQQYGYARFFFTLKDILQFSDEDYSRYGLSLILGTKEMSVEDIAKIYLGLGNFGEFGDIYYEKDHENTLKNRFLTKGSAYLTLDTIRNLTREGLENFHKDKKIISWKTGTSYGRKDAWAAGTSPKYTIVVWVGNFTGEANANLFGVKIAGKLLFELLLALNGVDKQFTMPDNALKSIIIDKPTGYIYTNDEKDFNITSTKTLYPIDAKPLSSSPFFKAFWVGEDLKKEINSLDKDFKNAHKIILLDLPISVLNYYSGQNIDIKPYSKLSQKSNKTLKIIYPTAGLSIIQPKDFSGKQKLVIRIANLNNQIIYWYLNTKYLGQGTQNTKEILVEPGNYTIYVIAKNGNIDSINFKIIK